MIRFSGFSLVYVGRLGGAMSAGILLLLLFLKLVTDVQGLTFQPTSATQSVDFAFQSGINSFSGTFQVDNGSFLVTHTELTATPLVTPGMQQMGLEEVWWNMRAVMSDSSQLNYSLVPRMPASDLVVGIPSPILSDSVTIALAQADGYTVTESSVLQAITIWWLANDPSAIEGSHFPFTYTIGTTSTLTGEGTTLTGFPNATSISQLSTIVRMAAIPYQMVAELAMTETVTVSFTVIDEEIAGTLLFHQPSQTIQTIQLTAVPPISAEMQADFASGWWQVRSHFGSFPIFSQNNEPLNLHQDTSASLLEGQAQGNLKEWLFLSGAGYGIIGSPTVGCILLAWLEWSETAVEGESFAFALNRQGVALTPEQYGTTTIAGFLGPTTPLTASLVIRVVAIPYQVVLGEPERTFLPALLNPLQPTPSPTPITIPDWLNYVNQFRAQANMPALNQNPDWSYGDWLHSRYMVKTDSVTHSENPASPWYSSEGNSAAQNGNIAVTSSAIGNDHYFIDFWMAAPFHAVAILDPKLQTTGFGSYREADGGWQGGGTLDVSRGRGTLPPTITFPIFFPKNGGQTWVLSYPGGEWPNPLTSCPGYTVPTGPPIILQMGSGNLQPSVNSYQFKQGSQNLPACVFTETTYTNSNSSDQNSGRLILNSRDAVVLMPQQPLQIGQSYTVEITINAQFYSWTFSAIAPTMPSQHPPEDAIMGEIR